jgi:hypothetical protein
VRIEVVDKFIASPSSIIEGVAAHINTVMTILR